jgi:DNA-binding transcriptional ArsR family regulator
MCSDVIDSLREQIKHRLGQLAEEADRLRQALAALGPNSTPSPDNTPPAPKAPTRKPAARKPAARKTPTRKAPAPPPVAAVAQSAAATATESEPKPTTAPTRPKPRARKPKATDTRTTAAPPATKSATARRTRTPASPTPRASASGATRNAVLSALGADPLTAGQVAEKTGLARPTVSTTLSRLAKSGEVQKAQRGYTRQPTAEPDPTQ